MHVPNIRTSSIKNSDPSSYRDALCRMIESSQMFADLPRQEIEIISHYVTTVDAKAGKTIFNEGEKGRQMYLIVKGSVKILKDSGEKTKSLTTVKQGHTMGEMSIFDDLPYSASAVAAERCRLVSISHENFDKLAQEHPYVGIKILKRIARLMSLRLRHTTGTLIDHID